MLSKEEGLEEMVLEDICCHFHRIVDLGSTKCSVKSSNHSGKSGSRSLNAHVVY